MIRHRGSEPFVSRGFLSTLAAGGFRAVTSGNRDSQVHADVPHREIAGRIRLTGRIGYPRGDRILPVTRICPVNPPGRVLAGAASAAGAEVTRPDAGGPVTGEGSEPDRRFNGQTARLARVFPSGVSRFPAGGDPRRWPTACGAVLAGKLMRRRSLMRRGQAIAGLTGQLRRLPVLLVLLVLLVLG